MSFFSEASLAMIPSGYKTSKVYSALPITGDGDLTFSRSNDTATRVGPNGYIEKVRTNICLQSEGFNTASWTAANTTITANAGVAPNGTTTADKIVPTTTGTSRWVEQARSITSSIPYTNSFYIKADGFSWVNVFHIDGNLGAYFNISNGTIGTVSSGVSASIVSVGSGWYRCIVTKTSGGSTGYTVVQLVDADGSTTATASGTNGVLVWGAQIETGDIATDYIATTSAAVTVGPVANVPRLDYLDSSSPRLLLEPQRTNLVTYSEQFDNAAWGKAASGTALAPVVTANNAISPDGYQNADTIVFDAGAGTTASDSSALFQTFGGTTATYTGSFYAKTASGTAQIQVRIDGSSYDKFTITNQWQRFTLTKALTGTSNVFEMVIRRGLNEPMNASATIQLWGVQVELGAYATSYIPTLGAAVTRGADLAQKSSISGLFGATATTFVFDFIKKENAIGWTITGDDGTKLFSLCQFDNTSGIPRVVFDDGVDTTSTLAALSNGRHKIAISYATNDTRIYIDGTLVLTDTVCTYYQMNKIGVNGTSWTGFTNNTNAFEINQFLMIPAATSNADLATLTTI